jgi:glycosyltransferase involved in cell wall biosynthesis
MAIDTVAAPLDLLHVHSGNIFGGVERMLQTIVTANPRPVSSRFGLCFEGDTAARLLQAGARIDWLGPVHIRRPDQVVRAQRRLRALLRHSKPDAVVVHSSWSQALFGGAVLGAGVPLVRWLHAPEPGPALLERWAWRRRPDRVVCNSEYTRAAAGDLIADVPADVCYPPASPSSAVAERIAVRRSLGTPEGRSVVVLAARPEPWKGHRRLIAALATIQALDWEAWIAGGAQRPAEREFVDALHAQAASVGTSGRVRFLGQRDDLPSLFGAADIYCQPNEGPEPFGLSVVEAMASGLPVVASAAGATPEIVSEECGILVGLHDDGGLARALASLIEDGARRRTMGTAARAASRRFTDLPGSMTALARSISKAVHRDTSRP